MALSSRRLHWACGELRLDGWMNADSEPGPGIDIACDIIVDGLPLESYSMALIYCSPGLQTLPAHDLVAALHELRRVLVPGGLLRLCVPDFEQALQAYRSDAQAWHWCWDWDTKDGNFLTQLMNYGYARSLFTRDFIGEVLRKAGFCDISAAAFGQTSSTFPECVELDRRPDECLFMEARKPATLPDTALIDAIAPRQIHLSWVEDPSTSLTVSWKMPVSENDCALEFRRYGTEDWKRVRLQGRSALTTKGLFSATMRDLLPDTEYEYRIVAQRGAPFGYGDSFRSRTAPPAAADFRFAFFCDTGVAGRPDGNASGTQQVIAAMAMDKPLFVLGGGDYAYANHDGRYSEPGEAIDAWFEQMQPLVSRHPLMAQYGNHEIYLGERFRDWAPRFAHPGGPADDRNYSFTVADTHFTSLFVTGHRLSPEQLHWLETDLGSARQRGVKWLIVYQHEPMFAHGHSHPARPEYRQWLAPVFERYRVDLHLSGHDQSYERTYPLMMAAADSPVCTSSALEWYQAGEGVIYAKVSPAGKKSESGNDFSRFTVGQQPFMAKRNDTAHHYALVSVRECGELQVEVFGLAGDGTPKFVVDSFRIVAGNTQRGGAGCRDHSAAQVDP